MATNLQTPILNQLTRSVNFFNGRLLTGEDLTSEQQTNRAARNLLGQAAGSGVVYGLEVSQSVKLSSPQIPVLTVSKGLAINRGGMQLLLADDTDVTLVRPADTSSVTAAIFQDCAPLQSGVYVSGAGVYLLTVSPASEPEGLAEVSGATAAGTPCNSNYNADGVQFRLVQIQLDAATLADTKHLQNAVAYQCFGVDNVAVTIRDPFNPPTPVFGLVDQLVQAQLLTACEVPLAIVYWTSTAGLVFVDMWSVRRPLSPAVPWDHWQLFIGHREIIGEAMFLQFQEQLADLLAATPDAAAIAAVQNFLYLPPVGFIPLPGASEPGMSYPEFFGLEGFHAPAFLRSNRVEAIVRTAFGFPPIDLSAGGAVWLYQPVQGGTPLPYLIFTNVDVPFQAQARFNVDSWNFSNFT